MRLLDANILLYAFDSLSPKHESARAFLEEALSGPGTVGFAWSVLLAFLRLGTNPRIFESPMTVSEALDLIDGWLQQPNVTILHPTDRHSAFLRELLEELGSAGNLTSDAHAPRSRSSTERTFVPSMQISRGSPDFDGPTHRPGAPEPDRRAGSMVELAERAQRWK
jgi:toxin-antitoxin system PIN domain toxin